MKIVSATVDNHHNVDLKTNAKTPPDLLKIDSSTYHVIFNSKSYKIEVVKSDYLIKKYEIKVNNKIHKVQLNSELDNLIKTLGLTKEIAKSVNKIHAPMPGLILEIMVENGKEVKEDEPLMILEAMKMENVILSPKTGVIKEISVTEGSTVDKNALLIEFEQ